jgi:hypothetical protein
MAVAGEPEIEHGPLELLFTVSEEQGLDGAKALDPSLVTGRLLINLDGTATTPSLSVRRELALLHTCGSNSSLSSGSRPLEVVLSGQGRPFRRRHRERTGERDQGARPDPRA